MKIQGNLKKMLSSLNDPIEYFFELDDEKISVNAFLGKIIQLKITGKIHCIHCGRLTNKSFQQGFCFPCFRRLQECNLCVIHPERCKVEEGTCPQDDWAHSQCHQPHIIYLANASGLKVGITRKSQVPTRWIDQGAIQAMPLGETKNRYQAGVVEVILKKYVSDRTNWRKMLSNQISVLNFEFERQTLLSAAEEALQSVWDHYSEEISVLPFSSPIALNYPILKSPEKITSLSLDKTPEITGTLLGIKGQYLIFDIGVLNIRKFSGYEVVLSTNF